MTDERKARAALPAPDRSLNDFAACVPGKTLPASALIAKLEQQSPNPLDQYVDWDHAPGWANWWAVDSDGAAYWYDEMPVLRPKEDDTMWIIGDAGESLEDAGECPLAALGIDWRETRMQRPQEVQE